MTTLPCHACNGPPDKINFAVQQRACCIFPSRHGYRYRIPRGWALSVSLCVYMDICACVFFYPWLLVCEPSIDKNIRFCEHTDVIFKSTIIWVLTYKTHQSLHQDDHKHCKEWFRYVVLEKPLHKLLTLQHKSIPGREKHHRKQPPPPPTYHAI